MSSLEERFWKKVARRGPGECWEWQAAKRHLGYGQISVNGKPMKAHRLSFLLANGYLPPVVRHACDNPPCVNPQHLLPGTHADNSADARARNRAVNPPRMVGMANAQSKLNDAIVREARELHANGESYHALAARYSVDRRTITQAVRGDRWSHV